MAKKTLSGSSFKITGRARQQLKQLEKLTKDVKPLLRAVSINQAEEAIDLIKQGFNAETDPYGDRWRRRKRENRRTRGRRVLSGETNSLKSGWKVVQVRADGFIVSASVEYALPHQSPRRGGPGGGLKRPRRMMIPSEKRGLPRTWNKALQATARDAMNDFLKAALE